MIVKQSDADKLNAFLAKWDRANVAFNRYYDDHDRLTIGLVRPDDPKQFIGVIFSQCLFLSGPTSWKSCQVRAHATDIGDGDIGFEIRDENAGFLLRCGGPVTVGNNQLVVPSGWD